MTNYRKTMAEALIEVFAEELSPDEIAKEQSKAIDQFNDDMAKEFPKEKFTARAVTAPMGGGITFVFAVIPTKDAKGVDLLNAPAHSKFMMHLTDNKNKAVPMSKFSIGHIMGRLPVKFRKVTGKSPTDAVKKMVDWFKKNKSDFEGLVKEEVELDEGREKDARQLVNPKKEVMVVKKSKVIVIDKKDEDKYLKQGWSLAEEVDLDEATPDYNEKGVDKEIEKSGIKKGSKEAKLIHRLLKGRRGSKKEEVDLDEGKMSQLHQYIKDKKSAEEIAKLMKVDVKTIKALMSSHHPEDVEEGAAADARKAIAKDKDLGRGTRWKGGDDNDATDDDIKGASKNIIMQLRKAISLKGRFDVEFLDKKKFKVPEKMAQAVTQKYNSLKKPADKEKFQAQIAKSYKDMLKTLKAGYGEQKESILERMNRKIKENKEILETSNRWELAGKKFSLVNDKGTYILVTQGTGKEQKLKATTPQEATQELVKKGYKES